MSRCSPLPYWAFRRTNVVSDDPLATRAARHLALPQIGRLGQERIASSTALIIGVGGIGCATATYLASSGVGRLILNDFDTVDATNLGRQPLYSPDDVGQLKAVCAADRLRDINPNIEIDVIGNRLDADALSDAIRSVDIVLDGCDNFATRFAVNDACVAERKTLISGAAIRFEGQLAVFGPDYESSPCYRCLYMEADESLDNCSGNGVLAPIPAVVGTLAATECLKILAGIETNVGQLVLFDALSGEWRFVGIGKNPECVACS